MHWESKYTDTRPSPFPPADDSAGGKGEAKGGVTCWQLAPVWQVGAANLSSPTAPFPLLFPSLLTFPKQVSSVFSAFCFYFFVVSLQFLQGSPAPPAFQWNISPGWYLKPLWECLCVNYWRYLQQQTEQEAVSRIHTQTHCVVTLLMHVSCCNPRRFDITISPRD